MKQYYPQSWILAICAFIFFPILANAQFFVNPIPIPYIIEDDTILLRIDVTEHNFNPNGDVNDTLNTMITTFAFNHLDSTSMTYLGPSLAWQYKHQQYTEVLNNLPDKATVHWHGAHVPTYTDGGPHQRIPADSTWKINFEILDKSATMWYHPHVLDDTYVQVQMGLSGMLYVEDPVDGDDDPILTSLHSILPTEYGVNDIPLIIQSKKFMRDENGDMKIDTMCCGTNGPGYKKDYEYVVNGYIDPYLEVPASMMRFRVLNGDAKFAFNFGFSDIDFNHEPFQLIATDAGYCDRSYQKTEILMAPGERTEWLVDLRGREGDTLYLTNFAISIPDDVIGSASTTLDYAQNKNLLQLIVGENTSPPSPIIAFPINLHPLEIPTYDDDTPVRTKAFYKEGPDLGNVFTIDHEIMNINVINDTVMLGSTEIWEIVNTTTKAHPWHIHDVHFYVIEITDANGDMLNPDDYPELFNGPLDNVLVQAGWTLKYVAQFEDFGTSLGSPESVDSTYMFHCHILPHEDRGMMGQFVVWNGQLITALEDPEDFVQSDAFVLFPNPAKHHVNLEGKSSSQSIARIYNLEGKIIGTHEIPPLDGSIELSLESHPAGLYLVEWATKEGRFIKRLLVQ